VPQCVTRRQRPAAGTLTESVYTSSQSSCGGANPPTVCRNGVPHTLRTGSSGIVITIQENHGVMRCQNKTGFQGSQSSAGRRYAPISANRQPRTLFGLQSGGFDAFARAGPDSLRGSRQSMVVDWRARATLVQLSWSPRIAKVSGREHLLAALSQRLFSTACCRIRARCSRSVWGVVRRHTLLNLQLHGGDSLSIPGKL